MKVGILDFQGLVEPLVLVLNEAHKQSGRKTKRSSRGMQLHQVVGQGFISCKRP